MRAVALEVEYSGPVYVYPHSLRIASILASYLGRAGFTPSNLAPTRFRFRRAPVHARDDTSTSAAIRTRMIMMLEARGMIYIAPGPDWDPAVLARELRGAAILAGSTMLRVLRAGTTEVPDRLPYPWNHVSLVNRPSQPPPSRLVVPGPGEVYVCHLTPAGKLCATQRLLYRGEPQVRVTTVYGPLTVEPSPLPGADEATRLHEAWRRIAGSAAREREEAGAPRRRRARR